jgi:hypothetical protein
MNGWMTYREASERIGQSTLDALIASRKIVVEDRGAEGLFVPRVTVEAQYRVGYGNVVASPTGFSEPTSTLDLRNLGPQGRPTK